MALSEELRWRGFVNQTTYKDITVLDGAPITFYWGVDPSADSMTVGNLAIAMMIRHFIKAGHKPVLLVGGATGMIGDPDGKSQERELLTSKQLGQNKTAIAAQYKKIFSDLDFELVDNYDWFKNMNYLDFLRDIGKHVPMRQMLGREFVQSRLGEDGAGISYAEFSYSLIQGYDFLHLHREMGVTLQVCGADQWGNCIAGVELIRRITADEANVWSAPLVVNKSTGAKFGKSEAGAIWLDPAKTSPFDFYQFWLNTDDDSVEGFLKIFTMLEQEQIESIMLEFSHDHAARLAQRTLAREVTRLVHSERTVAEIEAASSVVYGSSGLSEEAVPLLRSQLPLGHAQAGKTSVVEMLVETGLASSNGEARRLIREGGVYINNDRVTEAESVISTADTILGHLILQRGKTKAIIEVME